MQVEEKGTEALKRAKDNFGKQKGATDFLNWAQKQFKCCEFDNNATKCVVESCYPSKNCTGTRYSDDCKDAFVDFVENNLVVIGAVALAIAFVQVRKSLFQIFKVTEGLKVTQNFKGYFESFT